MSLSYCFLLLREKQFDSAHTVLKNIEPIIQKKGRSEYPLFANRTLLKILYESKNQKKWNEIFENVVSLGLDRTISIASQLSESEKSAYLNYNLSQMDEYYSMLYFFKSMNTNKIHSWQNLIDDWILNSSKKILFDSTLSKDVKKLRVLKIQFSKAISKKQDAESIFNSDSINSIIQETEKAIFYKYFNQNKNYKENQNNTKSKKKIMKKNSAVIHWVSFKYKSPQ